jgi:transcriptional regulator with XRE-family HTH domain
MATRANVSRPTLESLERGELSINLGLLARVLAILGMEEDLDRLAEDDELGRRLQDVRQRRPRRRS